MIPPEKKTFKIYASFDQVADEAVDCQLVELLREEILPFPNQVPMDFIRKIVVLLNKGSIHSSMTLNDDCSGSIGKKNV